MQHSAAAVQLSVEQALSSYVTSTSQQIAATFLPIASVAITIWVVVFGYAVLRGEVQSPMNLFVWKAIKIALITAFSLGGGGYFQTHIVGGLNALERTFVQAFFGKNLSNIGSVMDQTALQLVPYINDFYTLSVGSIKIFSFPDLGFAFAWLATVVSMAAIYICSMIPFLVAKTTFSLLIAFGPFFIFLFAWPFTQKFAESWMVAVLTSLFTVIVISAILSFAPKMYIGLLGQVEINLSAENQISGIDRGITIIFLSVILCWLTWNSSSIASQLMGGASLGNPASGLVQTLMNKFAFSSKSDNDNNKSGGNIRRKS